MNTTISDKLAVVTGATRGIGYAIAARLLKEGVRVVGTGTQNAGSVPSGCEYRRVNFSDWEQLTDFAEELSIIAPDILINNAGINKIAPFADLKLNDFQLIQQVNVTAPFLFCRAVIPGMLKKRWGRIVNISSIWGKISKALRGPYSASKFALDGMTASLAAEVAEYGILANCVSPGFIDTELTRTILTEKELEELAANVPMRRLGTPVEIAAFVVWLASQENTYISGQNIAIDGGFTRV